MSKFDMTKLVDEAKSYTISSTPKPVGYWILYPGAASRIRFEIYARPTDAQIKNTETLLGWGWEDANNTK